MQKRKLAIIIAALVSLPLVALAAVTPNSFVTPQTPNGGLQVFLQGTDVAGNYKTLYTAGANGSRCYSISVTNNDPSVVHLLQMRYASGVTQYGGAAFNTALSAGFSNNNPPQNGLEAFGNTLPKDAYGNQFIQLAAGQYIQMTFGTALTGGTAIWAQMTCSDF